MTDARAERSAGRGAGRPGPWRWFDLVGVAAVILWAAGSLAVAQNAQTKKKADPPATATEREEGTAQTPNEEDTRDLPSIDKIELPSFQQLMKGPPVDWIVLTNQKVLEVEPLYPRPGTLDDLNNRIKGMMRQAGQPAETEAARNRRLAMYYMPLTLMEGEERDYKLHIRFIREIIHFEELMLRRVDKLLDERQVRQAYELLAALEVRQSDWNGIIPRSERLLFVEAQVLSDARRFEQALASLESLHDRNPGYAGLEDQLGLVMDRLMSQAVEQGDPRQARFFLKRLARRVASHRVVATWTARLIQQARTLVQRAGQAERDGNVEGALDRAEEASRVWPELPELTPVYNRLASRFQRLRVGVVDLARAKTEGMAAIVPTPADRRHAQLTEMPLFDPARVSDKIARYETRIFQQWDPTDLGHSVVFRLRPFRLPDDSQPLVTAAGLTDSLAERIDPASGRYDARLAAAVTGLTVLGPFDLAVRFGQVPLRPEALFAFPYRRAETVSAGSSGDGGSPSPSESPPTYPFTLRAADDAHAAYRRGVPEPDHVSDRHIAEAIERRYDSHEKAIQGLLRGEVSLLPRIPAHAVKTFTPRLEFFTQPYGLPVVHLLQFHPRNRALQSRALRRALIYALDRPRLLEEVFLHEAPGALGRVVSAPWPSTIYAYNRFIKPHDFDPALAFSLTKNAQKELSKGEEKEPPKGGEKPAAKGSQSVENESDKAKAVEVPLPTLRIWVPDDPELREAATRIVAAWSRIGVTATLVSPASGAAAPSIDSVEWDVAYRAEVVAEPLVELWPLLALTNSTETTTLGYFPTWLRHDLLELDRAGDWRSAEQLLHRLHRQLWAEVHLIPLWEIDEHFVVRKNVRNIPDRPLLPYQGIEHWKIEPWYSRE